MKEKPESIRLAEWIEGDMTCDGDEKIAACLRSVQSRLEELENEMQEQCRIIGMSAERELSLISKMKSLEKDAARYRWLRDIGDGSWVPFCERTGYSAMQCDGAIDTAMQTNKEFSHGI